MINTNLISEESLKYIVENTILECNRVLHNWKENDKMVFYDDAKSLFRSYLAKFIKEKAGWQYYVKNIRYYNPLVVIHNYKVINIDFNLGVNDPKVNCYIDQLDKYVKNMDILKFSELHEIKPTIYVEKDGHKESINLSRLIDYEKLKNIKFT